MRPWWLFFSVEIGGNFAPVFGVPLAYLGGVGVVVQPCFGTTDDVPQLGGLWGEGQLGAAFFATHPVDGVDRVAVEYLVHVVFFEIGKAVHDTEELAYVVGAYRGFEVEELLAGGDVDTLVFHHTGIAATGCVDSQGVENWRIVGAGKNGGDAVLVGCQYAGFAGWGRGVGGIAFADGYCCVVGQAHCGFGFMEGAV